MSSTPHSPVALSRRDVFVAGGATLSLAALVAACGGSTAEAPGRVGNVPVPTDLPDVTVDDAALLRTGTSLEYTVLDLYARFAEAGWIGDDAAPVIERFVTEHEADAAALVELTTGAGGEPYECANTWLEERTVAPMMTAIEGNEAEGVEPSDDPARDVVSAAHGFESMTAASYQQFVENLTDPARRAAVAALGARAARRAAVLAILQTGAPEGYVSPTLWGETIDLAATEGIIPLYALTTRFGSLAAVDVTVGALTDAGSRPTFSLQTPADNAYVYEGQSCDV